MTRDEEFIRRLEGYLDDFEGGTPLPESVRASVRARLPSNRQRSARWPGRRFPTMVTLLKLAMPAAAAAALLVVAVLGVRILVPPPHPGTVLPLPFATPGELEGPAALAAGRYSIANPYTDGDLVRSCDQGCADYQRITFTVPDGWATGEGFVYKHFGEAGEVAFKAWTPDQVYADPCRWRTSDLAPLIDRHDDSVEPALGSSALASQLGRNASAPSAVTIGDASATRMELSVPADLDITTCDGGEYRSWTEWDVDAANSHHAAGQIDVIYLVDVDRRTLVIDVSRGAQASSRDVAELEAILASLLIDRGL